MHGKNKVYIHIVYVRKEKTVMITICRNGSCHPYIFYYTKTLPIIYYGGNESFRMVTFFTLTFHCDLLYSSHRKKKNEYKKHLAMRFLGFYYITRIVTSHTYLIYYFMVLLHRIIVGLLQKGTFWSKSVDFSNECDAKINCFKKIPRPIRDGILRTFMSMTVYINIDEYSKFAHFMLQVSQNVLFCIIIAGPSIFSTIFVIAYALYENTWRVIAVFRFTRAILFV